MSTPVVPLEGAPLPELLFTGLVGELGTLGMLGTFGTFGAVFVDTFETTFDVPAFVPPVTTRRKS